MKKSEGAYRTYEIPQKQSNIRIKGVPEGEERKGQRIYLKKKW